MKQRYRLIRRGERSSKWYCGDALTGKCNSLAASDLNQAGQIVLAKNQALRQPALNFQIAKVILADSNFGDATRIWQQALVDMVVPKKGEDARRWQTAVEDISSNRLSARLR